MGRCICNAAVAVLLMAAPGAAQSLGDLARQEEARRGVAKKAVKTLSNADLTPGAIAQPYGAPAEASCYVSRSKGTCVSPQEMVSVSAAGVLTKQNAPLEHTYRAEAESIRSQIEQTHNSIAILEGVVADQARSAGDRKGAETALVTASRTLAGLGRNWGKLAKALANQGLPHKWIEPVPTLTTVKQ